MRQVNVSQAGRPPQYRHGRMPDYSGAEAPTVGMRMPAARTAPLIARSGTGAQPTDLERRFISTYLPFAIERQQLTLAYQPVVNLATGQVTSAEARLGWTHPAWGRVPAEWFIPAIHEQGLMVAIGRWVLHAACLQARQWLDAGLPISNLAVKISAAEFRDPHFVGDVGLALAQANLPAQCLQLEIPASVLALHMQWSTAVTRALSALGVPLALIGTRDDDTSAYLLTRLPIDVCKLDATFFDSASATASPADVPGSGLLDTAQHLHLRLSAQGVEQPAQMAGVEHLHCAEGQGSYFSVPLAPDNFAAVMQIANGGIDCGCGHQAHAGKCQAVASEAA